mmetsp:Transcript_58318/g.152619  ORF Transcript_58318/g.152619 Transcript_58318/m.152619 type:complete len:229 (+) Transcript_58318:632-1318(+)
MPTIATSNMESFLSTRANDNARQGPWCSSALRPCISTSLLWRLEGRSCQAATVSTNMSRIVKPMANTAKSTKAMKKFALPLAPHLASVPRHVHKFTSECIRSTRPKVSTNGLNESGTCPVGSNNMSKSKCNAMQGREAPMASVAAKATKRKVATKGTTERSLRRSGVGSDATARAVSEAGNSGAWMPKQATVEKMQKRAKLVKPKLRWPTASSLGGWSSSRTRYISST